MIHVYFLPIYLIGMFGVSIIIDFLQQNIEISVKFCKNNHYNKSGLVIYFFQGYAVYTVLYRVFTFNDCPEAAEEIQKQIEEAKADLSSKGFKF